MTPRAGEHQTLGRTRFWRELVEAIQEVDRQAKWWPPSRPDAADDFVELSRKHGGGKILPNPQRAEEWLGHPAPRPKLQAVPDLPARRRRAGPRAHGQLRERVR